MSDLPQHHPLLTSLPNWEYTDWDYETKTFRNKREGVALWSGKKHPPAVGDTIRLQGSQKFTAEVLGYIEDYGFLMLWCRRNDGRVGDLAGNEIHEE